jgi:hypothetical protein
MGFIADGERKGRSVLPAHPLAEVWGMGTARSEVDSGHGVNAGPFR